MSTQSMTRERALKIIADVNAIRAMLTLRERAEMAGYTREQVLAAEDFLRDADKPKDSPHA